VNGRIYSRYVSAVQKKQPLFRATIFAKQKTNIAEQENDHHVIKATKENNDAIPDSTRDPIGDGPLRADDRWLFMLYWAARSSNVLITSLALNKSRALRT
jgi:hypothetical protein